MTSRTAPGDVAQALADLHAQAFDAPWSAAAFADLLGQTGLILEADANGFIVVRVVADEAEILTLAVRPSGRRAGLGARLVRAATDRAAAAGARRMFLEVAEDNPAARALYERLGFETAGRRLRYYHRRSGSDVDALLLVLNLA
ncbi:MAG: ribosomal protein S18-alanine N-acetyltransferase [Alphaproteobacteria bacterium]|nr:ribosomal protein S18-alanine N-acetyltransferase [Alphaproteobacteria bacterium]MBU2379830.1 ribosomal protein S18-alanine N-acetyltransferase [Alphaproteobacteria bacterium]